MRVRGQAASFRLPLSRRLAAIRVTAANAGGYRISSSRTVRLVAR